MSLQNGGQTSDNDIVIRAGRFYFREDAICNIESFLAPDGTIVGALVYRFSHDVPMSIHGADAQDLIDQWYPSGRTQLEPARGTLDDQLQHARDERDERTESPQGEGRRR